MQCTPTLSADELMMQHMTLHEATMSHVGLRAPPMAMCAWHAVWWAVCAVYPPSPPLVSALLHLAAQEILFLYFCVVLRYQRK